MRMPAFIKSVISLWLSVFFIVVVVPWHQDRLGYTAVSLFVAAWWFVIFIEQVFIIGQFTKDDE